MAKKTAGNITLNDIFGIKFDKTEIKRPPRGGIDVTFLLLVIIISCMGLIMLLSASAPTASSKVGNPYYFFTRQFGFAIAGFLGMLFVGCIDYRKSKPFAQSFMIICEFLLLLVLIVGVEKQGARRWLNTGFEWQPSELMKLGIAMFFARMIEDRKKDFKSLRTINDLKHLIPYIVWIVITALLLLMETHLSGTIIICGIALVIMIVAGLRLRLLIGTGLVALPLGILFLKTDPVRWARMENVINPFSDMQGVGYQVVQGLYAIATGGFFGLGLGQSVQKYSYLPEPYNDFIFAIVCEEMGLFGAIVVMLLFAGLIIRGIKIATEAPDIYGSLLVTGIMAQIAIQTILNIAVVTSIAPNTGVALPFFSYGGTSLLMLFLEMGLVLSVSRYSKKAL